MNLSIFILGLLIVNSLLILWFFSPLKVTLGEIIFKKTLMPSDFDDEVYSKNPILGKLISCWICLSFWLSLLVGTVMSIIIGLPLYWSLVCFLSYPAPCYLLYKRLK